MLCIQTECCTCHYSRYPQTVQWPFETLALNLFVTHSWNPAPLSAGSASDGSAWGQGYAYMFLSRNVFTQTSMYCEVAFTIVQTHSSYQHCPFLPGSRAGPQGSPGAAGSGRSSGVLWPGQGRSKGGWVSWVYSPDFSCSLTMTQTIRGVARSEEGLRVAMM